LSVSTSRRRFLALAAGAGVAPYAFGSLGTPAGAQRQSGASIGDGVLHLEFDSQLHARIWHVRGDGRVMLTPWSGSESLLLAEGRRIETFVLETVQREELKGPAQSGVRLLLTGSGHAAGEPSVRVEKSLRIELDARYPGFAVWQVTYRNVSAQHLVIEGWRSTDFELKAAGASEPQFWCYCGSTYEDRRDWVQPVKAGFSQDNFLGMTASDYGGGVPIADVWRRDCGLAVGHLETRPRLLSLPVKRTAGGVRIAIAGAEKVTLAAGEQMQTARTFLAVHTGDYFHTLDVYRLRMAEQGVCAPRPPASAYEAIWCAWGYERECTVPLIEGTLPKVRELGLSWAVVDDGWQTNVGDWNLDPRKFPRGDADMQQLVHEIRAHSLKPRLWITPLAAAPGSDLLHEHSDMLLLDKNGAPQLVTWWNCLYLCPAYAKTVAYYEGLVHRILGTWGYAGLKIDGQQLNGVAPCYNPAHHHERPEESVEGLQDFLAALYATAMRIDPQAVMELCPCGTGFSFFNLPSVNHTPASDPESSWQVRLKGKTLKALMGPSAPFAGDHVELSDGGDDFASTVGIGAIVSTKFTWPNDPKPKDSFLLTPEREALWRKWIALYNERMLPQGIYRGELYDIGFDLPEGHVVAKDGRLYYAFFARHWNGPVTLRGLSAASYRLRDYFNAREFGNVSPSAASVHLSFEHSIVLEAVPA
jgi:alpha-galactosidase